MRVLLLVVLATVLLVTPVAAEVRVLCYGDSITAGTDETNPQNSYPGELQRLRPDLEVLNAGRDGDVSGNVERFRAALAASTPDIVVLLLGTNDAVCAPSGMPGCDAPTPARSAENLLTMAAMARNAGAKVLVLTPPPSVCKADCDSRNEVGYAMWMREAFTGRLADELRRVRTPRGIRMADLRRRLSDAAWSTLSSDGMHPSGEGNRMIARFVAAYISRDGTPPASGTLATRRAREEPADARRAAISERNPFARKPQDRRYLR